MHWVVKKRSWKWWAKKVLGGTCVAATGMLLVFSLLLAHVILIDAGPHVVDYLREVRDRQEGGVARFVTGQFWLVVLLWVGIFAIGAVRAFMALSNFFEDTLERAFRAAPQDPSSRDAVKSGLSAVDGTEGKRCD